MVGAVKEIEVPSGAGRTGGVRAESTPGEGTNFIFTLPSAACLAAGSQVRPVPCPGDGQRRRG
jgi:hypothetical protein